MARILSLLPGNRTEPMSLDLIWRTFLTPPMRGNMLHGLPATGCRGGFCLLEGLTLPARTRGGKTYANQTNNNLTDHEH